MGQNGFGLKETIAFVFVVALSLGISGFLYNDVSKNITSSLSGNVNNTYNSNKRLTTKNNVSSYQELEKLINKSSLDYFASNAVDNVSLIALAQNNYIEKSYTVNNKNIDCNGYVSYNETTHESKTYLRCGEEYKTSGYAYSIESNY